MSSLNQHQLDQITDAITRGFGAARGNTSAGGAGRQLAIGGVVGTAAGSAAYGVGQIAGGPMGQLAGAGGALATGAAGMAAAGGPAGAAAAGLIAVATSSKLAYDGLKGFAAAASIDNLASLNKSFDVLSATVGRVLAPAFSMLGASVLTAADIAFQDLIGNTDDLANMMVAQVPSWISFAESLADATKAVIEFSKWVASHAGGAAGGIGGAAKGFMNVANNNPLGAFGAMMSPVTLTAMISGAAGVGGGGNGGTNESAGDRKVGDKTTGQIFLENMKAQLSSQIGSGLSKPTFGGAEDAFKKMQAASTADPIEQKRVMRHQETIKMLDRMIKVLEKEQPKGTVK